MSVLNVICEIKPQHFPDIYIFGIGQSGALALNKVDKLTLYQTTQKLFHLQEVLITSYHKKSERCMQNRQRKTPQHICTYRFP